MERSILWLDNDELLVELYAVHLVLNGYTVDHVLTVAEALERLEENSYELFILDVMLALSEEEERILEQDTDFGRKAGVAFYSRYKHLLDEKGVQTLVFTIRQSSEVKRLFVREGLPKHNYLTKAQANPDVLLRTLESLLSGERDYGKKL